MKNHIIVKLYKAAKRRHGGHGIHIYPGIHNDWHQSYAYEDGFHSLHFKLNRKELTCHCIAMDADENII